MKGRRVEEVKIESLLVVGQFHPPLAKLKYCLSSSFSLEMRNTLKLGFEGEQFMVA